MSAFWGEANPFFFLPGQGRDLTTKGIKPLPSSVVTHTNSVLPPHMAIINLHGVVLKGRGQIVTQRQFIRLFN